jgi:hypothetical protein
MGPRAERVGKNEAVFREVNERINEVTGYENAEYLCECGYANCTETIFMTVAEYEGVRFDPTHFAVLPQHELPEFEDVVTRSDSYLVVQKKAGAPAALAAELDPRS